MKRLSRNLHEEERVDEEGSWAISYGDMITVLMSFFILYFSMDPQEHNAKQLTKSLVAALMDQAEVENNNQYLPSNMKLGEEDGESVDSKIINILGAKLRKVGVKLVVEFPQVSFFESGQINLRPEAQKVLSLFVQKYTPYSGNFVLGVYAYTDNRPVKSKQGRRFHDNLELSALRSVAAMRVLQSAGISIQDMKITGYGENKVVFDKLKQGMSKDEIRKMSRKVVLVIEPKDKEISDEAV